MVAQGFYTSYAASDVGDFSDRDILHTSKKNNLASGVTGFLFRTETQYFQILEGKADILRETLKRIRADERHHGMKEWPLRQSSERAFSDWSMGYAILEQDTLLAAVYRNELPRPLRDVVADLYRLSRERYEEGRVD